MAARRDPGECRGVNVASVVKATKATSGDLALAKPSGSVAPLSVIVVA